MRKTKIFQNKLNYENKRKVNVYMYNQKVGTKAHSHITGATVIFTKLTSSKQPAKEFWGQSRFSDLFFECTTYHVRLAVCGAFIEKSNKQSINRD